MRINEPTKRENMRKILKMVDVTIILHNFLLSEHDDVLEEWMNQDDVCKEEEETADEESVADAMNNTAPSDLRRQEVQAYIAEHDDSSDDEDSSSG